MMKLEVTIDRDEDGVWKVECPAIPGCVSQGDSREQALSNIREAIALCMEARVEEGLPPTLETRQIAVAPSAKAEAALNAKRSESVEDLREFFRKVDEMHGPNPGREPDWSEHLRVINQGRARGQSGT